VRSVVVWIVESFPQSRFLHLCFCFFGLDRMMVFAASALGIVLERY